NSIVANSNAAINAATRVFYSLGRNRLAPPQLARTHARFKTPNVAIIWMSAFALVLSLLVGWKWNPGVGFGIIATAAVPLVIVVYMLVCVGCMVHYLTVRRADFNPLLHLVLPIGGIVPSSSRSTTSTTRCRPRIRSSTRTGSRSRGRGSASRSH